jgi:YidC/Oxa1 family membrane protein insertase
MDRKFLTTMLLSAATVFALNYYMGQGQSQNAPQAAVASGESFRVLSDQEVSKKLLLEADFAEQKIPHDENRVTVQTDSWELEFSAYGGALASVSYLNRTGKDGQAIRTLENSGSFERAKSAFLVMLDQATPYFYELVDHVTNDDNHVVTFQTQADGWLIRKIYTVPSDGYTINVGLEFEKTDANASALSPYLWMPTPHMPEVKGDVYNGVVWSMSKDALVKTPQKDSKDLAWALPEMFGAEDKYFVHVMLNDSGEFARRGYYTTQSQQLVSVIEGPELNTSAEFDLSFYVGPKDLSDFAGVDERLEGVLDFGWLSWLCKLLLRLLEWLYSIFENYGLAIIAMTVLIKVPLLPLSIKGAAVMERYQKYQPQINRIRERYRGDMQRQQEELMRFHKEHDLAPGAQLVGCLPLLIDLPIIFALYKVLGNYIDLYHAPFGFWITDLSARDPYFVLPIIAGMTMLWQQSMQPISDGKQRVIMYFSAIFMTAVFINFPAGLVLYWASKNILTVGETYIRKYVFKLGK